MRVGLYVYVLLLYYKGVPAVFGTFSSYNKAVIKINDLKLLNKRDTDYKIIKETVQ